MKRKLGGWWVKFASERGFWEVRGDVVRGCESMKAFLVEVVK
jgi:hypothetical protein